MLIRALKKYAMIVADDGSNGYLTGDGDDRWTSVMDDVVNDLGQVHGSDFEVVWTGAMLP